MSDCRTLERIVNYDISQSYLVIAVWYLRVVNSLRNGASDKSCLYINKLNNEHPLPLSVFLKRLTRLYQIEASNFNLLWVVMQWRANALVLNCDLFFVFENFILLNCPWLLFSSYRLSHGSEGRIKMATLTPAQRKHVQDVWSVPAQNPLDLGEELILTFVEKFPIYKDYFPMFKDQVNTAQRFRE